jgi:hypothetical protein
MKPIEFTQIDICNQETGEPGNHPRLGFVEGRGGEHFVGFSDQKTSDRISKTSVAAGDENIESLEPSHGHATTSYAAETCTVERRRHSTSAM